MAKKKAKKVTVKKKRNRRSSNDKAVKDTSQTLPRAGTKARRAMINREINQRELRAKIAAGNHHYHILKTIEELDKLYDAQRNKKKMDRGEQALFMSRLGALRTKLDAQFKLLNKYLPDLKMVDFGDGQGNNPMVDAARAWAQALSEPSEYNPE